MEIINKDEFYLLFSQGLLLEHSNRWSGFTNYITYHIEVSEKFYQFEVIYNKWMGYDLESGKSGEGSRLDLTIFPIKCKEIKQVEKVIKVWELV